ncbi:isoflavone reductase [Plectosphaerella plurivora]|uniref:Isoflavone reductase n=1 Tax=Plectosphaerella plurivora TaxID=936078 RepID=A0A9P9ADF6_9PEZI|nr:isoflavone reductase [Plectosphaerella plurivora]
MSLTNVTVVGASGNAGSAILPTLVKSGLTITALSRESSSATFPEGVKVVKTDFSPESLQRALTGQDAVVSMIPIVALAEQQKLAEAALAAGVKLFVPSEYGSDTTNEAVLAAVPFFQAKKDALDWLKSKEDQMAWTALFTGPFFDWGLKMGMMGLDRAAGTVKLIDDGKARFTASTVGQIARALVAILKNPDQVSNKLIFVESFTVTQAEVVAAIEKVTGEKYTVLPVSSQALREQGYKQMQEGDIMGGGGLLIMALILGEGGLEDHSHIEGGMWNARLGLENEDLEEVLKATLEV